ncbi:hypothetical protein DL96DRAFT_1619475 [Flagelloscypha sp. PMI_526]|nr:hypothetical protein DL96DRAFT_1619475 [Flagelloscypha sp. PMI_526]
MYMATSVAYLDGNKKRKTTPMLNLAELPLHDPSSNTEFSLSTPPSMRLSMKNAYFDFPMPPSSPSCADFPGIPPPLPQPNPHKEPSFNPPADWDPEATFAPCQKRVPSVSILSDHHIAVSLSRPKLPARLPILKTSSTNSEPFKFPSLHCEPHPPSSYTYPTKRSIITRKRASSSSSVHSRSHSSPNVEGSHYLSTLSWKPRNPSQPSLVFTPLNRIDYPISEDQHSRHMSLSSLSTLDDSSALETPDNSDIGTFWEDVFHMYDSMDGSVISFSQPVIVNEQPLPSHPPTERTIRFEMPSVAPRADMDDLDLPPFHQWKLPSQRQLQEAARQHVVDASGVHISFGSLFEKRKTIVVFIRHFWCPLCQDYMFSISRGISKSLLDAADVDLVVVSNGSHEMIPAYRRIFKTPFEVYTDPELVVYNALGMTMQTLDKGPKSTKGSYVRHGMMSGIGMVVGNAVKVGMPVWEKGGEIAQLGGEFILGPGLSCEFAHRMRYTRDHMPIVDVVAQAGVNMLANPRLVEEESNLGFLAMSAEAEDDWMAESRKSLALLRKKKRARRLGLAGDMDQDDDCDELSCSVRWGSSVKLDQQTPTSSVYGDSVEEVEELETLGGRKSFTADSGYQIS